MTEARVVELWRYPVKSMGGEPMQRLDIDLRGTIDDRRWAVYDTDRKLGSGRNSGRCRRMDGLLDMSARLVDGIPVMSVPGEGELTGLGEHTDAALSRALARPGLRLERESDIRHLDASPIHIVTTASLRWLQHLLPDSGLSPRRFRPNIVLDVEGTEPVEQAWIGSELTLGSLRLRITGTTERCRMVGAEQPGLDDDNRVLKTLGAVSHVQFGVYASVEQVGVVSVGDRVAIQ